MTNNTNISDVEADLKQLIGERICKIIVHRRYIDFVFGGAIHVTMRIKKDFEYSIDGAARERFQLEKSKRIGTPCYSFVEFLDKKIEKYFLSQRKLVIMCAENSTLSVILDKDDFEPIEIIGVSGPHGNQMEFYHVF